MRPAIHPGEILGNELKEIGVSISDLARQLEMPVDRINDIVEGRRAISGDTALRLGHWFQTSPEFWLNLQTAYDLRVADLAAGEEIARLPVRSLDHSRAVPPGP